MYLLEMHFIRILKMLNVVREVSGGTNSSFGLITASEAVNNRKIWSATTKHFGPNHVIKLSDFTRSSVNSLQNNQNQWKIPRPLLMRMDWNQTVWTTMKTDKGLQPLVVVRFACSNKSYEQHHPTGPQAAPQLHKAERRSQTATGHLLIFTTSNQD